MKSVSNKKRRRTTMNMNPEKLRRARTILGTKTDTEAVERSLDLVLENAEIAQVIEQSFGKIKGFSVK